MNHLAHTGFFLDSYYYIKFAALFVREVCHHLAVHAVGT